MFSSVTFQESKPSSSLPLYGRIKVIQAIYNSRFQSFHLTFFYSAGSLAVIFGAFLTISFSHEISGQIALLVYPLIALDALGMTLFICYASGKANLVSHKLKKNWLRDLNCKRKHTLLYKMIKAAAPFKIRFGSNFMEISTVFITLHFCFSSTVNLLLLSNRN